MYQISQHHPCFVKKFTYTQGCPQDQQSQNDLYRKMNPESCLLPDEIIYGGKYKNDSTAIPAPNTGSIPQNVLISPIRKNNTPKNHPAPLNNNSLTVIR
jgi:hypothetical protein